MTVHVIVYLPQCATVELPVTSDPILLVGRCFGCPGLGYQVSRRPEENDKQDTCGPERCAELYRGCSVSDEPATLGTLNSWVA